MSSLPQRRSSPEVPDWTTVGRKPAKAGLPEKPAFEFGAKLWDVLVHGHGGAKEAAYTMGIDRSLLRRKTIDGSLTLEELLQSKPEALVAVGEFFCETFGEKTKSRAQIARAKIPELLAAILDAVSEGETK
jgi:hypothetical protein